MQMIMSAWACMESRHLDDLIEDVEVHHIQHLPGCMDVMSKTSSTELSRGMRSPLSMPTRANITICIICY